MDVGKVNERQHVKDMVFPSLQCPHTSAATKIDRAVQFITMQI
jgi:hypothetical protein